MKGACPQQAALTADNDLCKIADNWVMVDFPYVMQQLGVDPFGGQGWEHLDSDGMPLCNGSEALQ